MSWELIFQQTVAGLSEGAILFLMAGGFTLIFGTLHVLNFAHGSFYVLGAYTSYSIAVLISRSTGNFLIALIAAPVAIGLFGAIIEMALFRPIYKREFLYQFLLTFGLVLVLGDFIRLIWGTTQYSMPRPRILSGITRILGEPVPFYTLFSIGMAALVGIILRLVLAKSRFGKLVRAIQQDREMASCLAINVPFICTAVFAISCWLTGLGGAISVGSQPIMPGLEVEYSMLSFIVVIVGGMGSLGGAAIGALIIGLAESFGVLFLPRLTLFFIYVILAVVLLVRPWGLLGKPMAE
jgi:branched-subunit amino acid ABC-type transport system permease component